MQFRNCFSCSIAVLRQFNGVFFCICTLFKQPWMTNHPLIKSQFILQDQSVHQRTCI